MTFRHLRALGSLCIAFALCLGQVEGADAQNWSASLEAGIIEYDAGGDQTYPTFVLRGGYEVIPWLRMGLGLSYGAIGEIPRGPAFESGGDESLWRFFGSATAVADRPFRNSGIAVIDHISPEAGLGIGVVHSAGLEVNPDIFDDPFNGIEDEPTGLALGLSLGLAFEISTAASIRASFAWWRDHLYGSTLDDFELRGGFQYSW